MTKLFISYAHTEKEIVRPIARDLQDLGFDVWIDTRGLKGGSLWGAEIDDAIAHCDFFLLFVSFGSMESDSVRREVQLAYEKKKQIIPIRLEEVGIAPHLNFLLAGILWIDYKEPDWKSRLLMAIQDSTSRHVHLEEKRDFSEENAAGLVVSKITAAVDVGKEVKDISKTTSPSAPNETMRESLRVGISNFVLIIQYISDFESKINQSATNLNILITAEAEFENLAKFAKNFASHSGQDEGTDGFPHTSLVRIAELAENVASQVHGAAASIASHGNPVSQLGQVSRNLPILHNVIRQLLGKLQKN